MAVTKLRNVRNCLNFEVAGEVRSKELAVRLSVLIL